MPLESKIEHVSTEVAIVTLTGSLSMGSSLSLADAQVRKLIQDGVTKMVVDVSGVTHADSSGLGFLMHANGTLDTKGGTMRIAGVGHRLQDLLTMTRVDQLLHIDADAKESLHALGVS